MAERKEKSHFPSPGIVGTLLKGQKEMEKALLEDSEEMEEIPEELPEMIVDAFSNLPPEQQEAVIVKLWNARTNL